MDDQTKFALDGGLLMLLFSTVLILGLTGCCESSKPFDLAWDKNCQRNYSERQRDFDACKKKLEKEKM